MAKAPTYQELNRQKAESAAIEAQMQQRNNVARETEMRGSPNPILSEYMSRGAQQGLTPREPVNEYAMLAENVARSVPDQESYSMAMIEAAIKGQVPAEAVLADQSILEEAKIGLIEAMRQNQGLGQIV